MEIIRHLGRLIQLILRYLSNTRHTDGSEAVYFFPLDIKGIKRKKKKFKYLIVDFKLSKINPPKLLCC